jgi:hypothetical protein
MLHILIVIVGEIGQRGFSATDRFEFRCRMHDYASHLMIALLAEMFVLPI